MQKCPGQDTRYWKPSDVTEVACGKCGEMVEFFKTDGARRCPGCGTRVVNPSVSMGCAQWCKHARECLGFDPATLEAAHRPQDSLADRLILALKTSFGTDQRRVRHALRVLDHAEAILEREGAAGPGGVDPRVVVAAALLHDIGIIEAERRHGSSDARYQEEYGPPAARAVLEGMGFGAAATDHVCSIIANHHSGRDIDTPEFRIVWDADRLVNIAEGDISREPEALKRLIAKAFRTETGKRMAYALFVEGEATGTAQGLGH
jgi:predicted HD phosphohydrolase